MSATTGFVSQTVSWLSSFFETLACHSGTTTAEIRSGKSPKTDLAVHGWRVDDHRRLIIVLSDREPTNKH